VDGPRQRGRAAGLRAGEPASNLEEFREAVRLFPGPAQNFVYADDAGHIAWYSAGRAPIRRTGDGSRPYPGPSDEGDWTGLMPFEEFDRAAGRWPQYRLDNRDQHVTPSGGRGEDGALVLVSAGDAGALRRRRVRVLSDGRLAQAWEESDDGGKRWSVKSEATMVRVRPPRTEPTR